MTQMATGQTWENMWSDLLKPLTAHAEAPRLWRRWKSRQDGSRLQNRKFALNFLLFEAILEAPAARFCYGGSRSLTGLRWMRLRRPVWQRRKT